ncbi:MAG: hypothetical protein VX519_01675 [Myxococcota bacterium]|nr:hypothetical protein [Myxococcota bacterium]
MQPRLMIAITLVGLSLACSGSKDTEDTADTGDTADTADVVDTADTGEPEPADLALYGDWDDNYGANHIINNQTWETGASVFHLAQYDNEAQFAIAHNDISNEWNADLWSRFDWHVDAQDRSWFCLTAYDAADEETARSTEAADATDPSSAGCGGFSWTELRTSLPIGGVHTDNWGSAHTINAFSWTTSSGTDSSVFHISQSSIENQYAIAENDAANPYNPGAWSRFDWSVDADGVTWFCQTTYDAADEATALATPAADASDPADSGCGGYSWSQFIP